MSEHAASITFISRFKGVRSTVDGGWTLTLCLDNTQAPAVIDLNKFREMNLQVAVIPINQNPRPSVLDEEA